MMPKKKLDVVEKERDKLLLEYNQIYEEKKMIKDKLKRSEDKPNKASNNIDKKT